MPKKVTKVTTLSGFLSCVFPFRLFLCYHSFPAPLFLVCFLFVCSSVITPFRLFLCYHSFPAPLFLITQERNPDNVVTFVTFFGTLSPICHPFVTFNFLCTSAEKPAVMRFLRCIFIIVTLSPIFRGCVEK